MKSTYKSREVLKKYLAMQNGGECLCYSDTVSLGQRSDLKNITSFPTKIVAFGNNRNLAFFKYEVILSA